MSEGDKFTFAYKDTLQSPLQPLMDNLEAQTYEVFERCSVKYQQYESALVLALTDIVNSRRDRQSFLTNVTPTSSEETSVMNTVSETGGSVISVPIIENEESETVVVTVVGAGRGPLVAAALSAASRVGVEVRVYAVEKNRNAVVTLRNRVISERWSNVTVLAGDMRSSQPVEKADIMVSELLGSWGCNELSPECLDGASSFLKEGGISIPCSYTSYIGKSQLILGL